MPVEVMTRPKNDYEKNWEERKKLLKEYQQKIDNNASKWPTYVYKESDAAVLRLLLEYVQSFGVSREYQQELIKTTGSNG